MHMEAYEGVRRREASPEGVRKESGGESGGKSGGSQEGVRRKVREGVRRESRWESGRGEQAPVSLANSSTRTRDSTEDSKQTELC